MIRIRFGIVDYTEFYVFSTLKMMEGWTSSQEGNE